ncbi:MAG TPA: galactokinase [Methylomirabilota bacterium]|jgi:galactokinase|nr:galactokinase [Methylomirabilota bacterium]
MAGWQDLQVRFREKFGTDAQVYRAPGRVNLIGEFTDFNDGFVMPAAIGFYCWVAIGPRADGKIVIDSENFAETIEYDPAHGAPRPARNWSDYPFGVVSVLQKAGFPPQGANLLIHGEVPMGSGLSSSAAIEVATGYALLDFTGVPVRPNELARLAQQAENDFVGARCGIMDQFTSTHGRSGKAVFLDCRTLDYELEPIPDSVRLVICNTMVKHAHSSGEYNKRRSECEAAVRTLSRFHPGIRALRDATLDQIRQHREDMPDVVYRRALHVVAEDERVLDAVRALRSGDLAAFGRRMAESHASLRDLFEVSSPELDRMVEFAESQPGVYGTRMTGGGFGGCTINLVEAGHAEAFRARMMARYEEAFRIRPDVQICEPAEGAGRVA